MFQTVDVAAISFLPEKFALAGNADRLEALFREAAKGGAQLAVAPEGILEGYVVNQIVGGTARPEDMNEVAVTMRGPVIRRFRNLAKELGISLAFGCAEKIGRDIFNCAVYIDHTGQLCGKYHKMQLAEGSHRSWWFNRLGKHSRAFNTPYGRCGFLICNDRWNADIARIPVLDGARFLLIPSFGSRTKKQDFAVMARARENGVPIVGANVGVTMVVNKGEIVGLSRKQTNILYATIDIAATPSPRNRDAHERSFLAWRKKEMPKRYAKTMKGISWKEPN